MTGSLKRSIEEGTVLALPCCTHLVGTVVDKELLQSWLPKHYPYYFPLSKKAHAEPGQVLFLE